MKTRGRVIAAAVVTWVIVTAIAAFHLLDTLELPARDRALSLLPQRSASVTAIVAIDEESIRSAGSWPWSRDKLARIVDASAAAGARAVILDILLTEPRAGDERLAVAVRRIPTIAVSVLDERGEWLVPAESIRNGLTPAHGNFEVDHDGIVRRLAATKQSRDRSLNAVSLEAAAVLTAKPVPVGQTIAPEFRTRPRAVPLISAAAILRDAAAARPFRDRLVFVGPTALGLGDRVLTPVSGNRPDPGVTVHAAATESLVRGELVHELPPIASGLLAGLAVTPIIGMRRRRSRLLMATGTVAAIVAGGMLLLLTTGLALPFIVLLFITLGSTVTVETIEMTAALRQTSAAAAQMESGLGMETQSAGDVAPRLEEIATHLAVRRAREAESKRILAHELKTPLASMRNLTQLLGGFELTEAERKRVASLLEGEAVKLQSMVNGLLDLERLSLRDFHSSTTIVDLSALAARRVEFLHASTDRELVADIAPGVVVRADAQMIERAVDNLIGNAIKYAPAPSPVTLSVRAAEDSAVVEVRDHGPGIGAADRARIFDRFYRGVSAGGTEGLGLGLSLVAEVAQWHHGTVQIEDMPGGGALFRITLPLAVTAARAGGM